MRKAVLHLSFLALFLFQSTLWPVLSVWAEELPQEEELIEEQVEPEPQPQPEPEEEEVPPENPPEEDPIDPEPEEIPPEEDPVDPDPQEEPPQDEPVEPDPEENPPEDEPVDPEPDPDPQDEPMDDPQPDPQEEPVDDPEPDPDPEEDPQPDPEEEPDPEPQPDPPLDPPPGLVISEVMLGSEVNPEKDDWFELYNFSNDEILLDGWQIRGVTQGGNWIDLTSLEVAAVQPHSYYVVSHYTNSNNSAQELKPQSNKSSINFVEDLVHIELKNPQEEIIDIVEFTHEPLVDEYRSYERLSPVSEGTVSENWLRSSTQVNLKEDLEFTFASPQAPNSHELLPGPVENLSYELIPMECPEWEEEEEWFEPECFEGEAFLLQLSWENPELADQIQINQLNDDWEWDPLTIFSAEEEPFLEAELIGQQSTSFQFTTYDVWGRPSEAKELWIDTFETVLINEFFADPLKNDSKDEFIELWNVGMVPVDLSYWELTTNVESADEDDLYIFADEGYMFSDDPDYDYILEPGEYFTLYADYSLLRLSNKQGVLTLFDDWGWVMDEYNYASYLEGYSQGRGFSDLGSWEPFFHPTPNGDNLDFNTSPVPVFDFQNSPYMSMNVTGENSYDAEGDKLTFEWSGDEGFSSDKKNPGAFTFSTEGIKTITLTVTDAYGDSAEVVRTFNAQEKQTAQAKVEEIAEKKTYPKHQLINEFMVNPKGKDTENEWVELYNSSAAAIDLSGWYLDDDEGKSGAEKFEEGTLIKPGEFLLIMGPGLSFKNSDDMVRLLNPNKEPTQTIAYIDAQEAQTYAKNSEGDFVWTPLITPGQKNQFPLPPKAYQPGDVTFERVLPNPHGTDGENEKIVLKNHTSGTIDLSGWILEDAGEHQTDLVNFTIQPGQSLTLVGDDIGFSLNNSDESLTLYDGTGTEIDFIKWKKVGAGQWLVDPSLFSDGMQVKVTQVVDGDTFKFDLGDGTIFTTRMLGIDTPETVHPFKPLEFYGKEASNFLKQTLMGQTVTLEFDATTFDKYGRVLVYVYLEDGTFVNAEVIKKGYGYAYTRFPFKYLDDFVRYEQEAKDAGRGLWHHEEIREMVEELIEEEEELWAEEDLLEDEELLEEEEFIVLEELVEDQEIVEADHDLPPAQGQVEEIEDWLECALGDLKIDAFMPAPEKGQEEWIRLINTGKTEVCLESWMLDDIEEGGSKIFTLAEEKLAPGEVRTFYKSETKVNLNNSKGDAVRLLNPLGKEVDRIDYTKTHKNEIFTHKGGDWVPKSRKKSSSNSSKKKSKRHKFDREPIAYQYGWVNEVLTGSFELGDEGEIYILTAEGNTLFATFIPGSIDWEMVEFLGKTQEWEFQLHSDETGRELVGLAPVNQFSFFPVAFADGLSLTSSKRVYGWTFGLFILVLGVGMAVGRRRKDVN